MFSSATFLRLCILLPTLATLVLTQGSPSSKGQTTDAAAKPQTNDSAAKTQGNDSTPKTQANDSATKPSGDGETLTCIHYIDANTSAAGCNDVPGRVCTKGCRGGVVANNCTLKEGQLGSTQTCSILFGKSSATISVCGNQQGYFSCTGSWDGNATCSGCHDNVTTSGSGDNEKGSTPAPTTNHNTPTNGPSSGDSGTQNTTSAAATFSVGALSSMLIVAVGALLN
ncbi:hypothetical protein O181_009617 [Austropuccinia psidii MF-1]|uniref:Secreted protein n=1 Tax=Austropuccinia psidii MF-1 TaxID=1389203 RepID=A0A9Q3GKG8_9BASI|nr:hypothetical protein [Austropuccinia psidii MF-1]